MHILVPVALFDDYFAKVYVYETGPGDGPEPAPTEIFNAIRDALDACTVPVPMDKQYHALVRDQMDDDDNNWDQWIQCDDKVKLYKHLLFNRDCLFDWAYSTRDEFCECMEALDVNRAARRDLGWPGMAVPTPPFTPPPIVDDCYDLVPVFDSLFNLDAPGRWPSYGLQHTDTTPRAFVVVA